MRYRKAAPEDIQPAIALWLRVWDEFIVNDYVETDADYHRRALGTGLLAKYESGERFMIVAADGGQIIGAIGADMRAGAIKPPVCVDRRHHRRGIATELLHRMVCELKVAGWDAIKVNSSRYALPFYESYGFAQTGPGQQHNGFISVPMTYTPNEIWDVYDKNWRKTGRLHERGRPMAAGDHHLIVHVWKRNSRGEWLIDRRTPRYGNARLDGKWETTGGCAVAGDDSLTAALREAKEELGIDLDPAKGTQYGRIPVRMTDGHTFLVDVWVFEYDEPIESAHYDGSEVCDAKWASVDEIRRMTASGEFLGEDFYPYFNDMVENYRSVIPRSTRNLIDCGSSPQ